MFTEPGHEKASVSEGVSFVPDRTPEIRDIIKSDRDILEKVCSRLGAYSVYTTYLPYVFNTTYTHYYS